LSVSELELLKKMKKLNFHSSDGAGTSTNESIGD
jgi:hypothetical protein